MRYKKKKKKKVSKSLGNKMKTREDWSKGKEKIGKKTARAVTRNQILFYSYSK